MDASFVTCVPSLQAAHRSKLRLSSPRNAALGGVAVGASQRCACAGGVLMRMSGGQKKELTPDESREQYKKKKVSKAAEIQKSQSFADAWAEQNRGKVDVWLIIGLLFFLVPFGTLAGGIMTGIIPLN